MYTVTQKFHTENNTECLETKYFSTKKEAVLFYNKIKDATQQGGQVETFIFNDKTEREVLSQCNDFDNTENYGKLIIAFQHEGKGMNYCHKFLDAFWLDNYNEKNLSDNPDYRFKVWHFILDLKIDDLNGLSYEDAQTLVSKEAGLKLNNSIDLENLGIDFA
jgi:hypothetical protein